VHRDNPSTFSDYNRVHTILLQYLSGIQPYTEIHMRSLRTENPPKSAKWITNKHNATFASWLKDYCGSYPYDPDDDANGDKEMVYNLAHGPQYNLRTYQAYDINGYTFYTEAQDRRSVYQNSGVMLQAYESLDSETDTTSKTKKVKF